MYNLYIIHILNLKTVRIQQFQKNYKYKTPEFEKHKNSANSEIQQKKKRSEFINNRAYFLSKPENPHI